MAGGIDWFRWHHGSVSDQKFVLIARRSGASVAEVIAVWACLLEQASTAADRGCAGLPDFEAMDCALGMADGRAQAVYEAMLDRQMLNADGFITSWEKRQPKRERDDDKSTERVRAFREKQRHETPGNATERAETPRGEESREEKSNTSSPLRSEEIPAKPEKLAKTKPEPCPEDVAAQVWADWLALRKAKKAPVTATVIARARYEAGQAGLTFEAFLVVWCARGSQGLEASWLKPHERGSPQQATETAWQRSQRERVEEATGGLLSTRRHTKPVEFTDADCTPAAVPLALG